MFKNTLDNRQSDITYHVCPVSKEVWRYDTKLLHYHSKNGWRFTTSDTSRGYLIPVDMLIESKQVAYRDSALEILIDWSNAPLESEDKDTVGDWAEQELSVWLSMDRVYDKERQVAGIDLVRGEQKVQVKYDRNGGSRENGGTGNLYYETHERRKYNV